MRFYLAELAYPGSGLASLSGAPRVIIRGRTMTKRAGRFDLIGFADCSPNRAKAYLQSEKKRYGDRFLLKYKFILARIFFGLSAWYNLNNP